MKVGIPKEIRPGERRVAGTPGTVKRLIKMGFDVVVEAGAGNAARLHDPEYVEAGAAVEADSAAVWASDIVLKINPPGDLEAGGHEADLLQEHALLISLLDPAQNEELVKRLAERKASAIAMDRIPRISRAQKMDVLSSMANIAGYRAVVEAANHYGGFFGGQITAAGKTRPARVLVIGAGVAGLAAIAAARGMGAEVRSFDVRPATKEQIESLGAKFLMLDFPMDESGESAGGYANIMSDEFIAAEMELFAQQAKEVDIIVTTALIPGRPAPLLITKAMVESMRPGSVIVDLAAEKGGNCELTEPEQLIEHNNVTIIGYTDLTSRLATHASQFYGTNLCHLLSDMGGGEEHKIDYEDEVVRKSLVCWDGKITWPPPPDPEKPKVAKPAPTAEKTAETEAKAAVTTTASSDATKSSKKDDGSGGRKLISLASAVTLTAIGLFAPSSFIQHFTVFVLACFVGWQVVWNVKPALHTPLMSVTNAISGIIIVGGMLQAATGEINWAAILGAVAILVASINIAGGFLVTQRMLQMFRREGN